MSSTKTIKELLSLFGFTAFRGKQEAIIRAVMAQQNCLILMPTGMGKSLCYQLPALGMEGLCLVVSPLIALMKDQVDSLRVKGIEATYINSSLNRREREKRYEQVAQGRYKLLYVTPERFRKQDFLAALKNRRFSILAIDEAHCISQWGHDFRPDYTRLGEIRRELSPSVTVALTATATPEVQKDIMLQLGLKPENIEIYHEGIERPNLTLEVRSLRDESEKDRFAVDFLTHNPGPGVLYFSLIKSLERFSGMLSSNAIPHLVYHGDLSPPQRKKVQDTFMQAPQGLVLATNAFGMGIDKADIRFVLHLEVPGSLEAYYQEIGRAGRDGQPARCILLYLQQDLLIQMDFIKWNNPDAEFYRRLYAMLADDPEDCNAAGIDGLKKTLLHKHSRDFRLETALALLERYGVTQGSIESRDLRIIKELPPNLAQQKPLETKKNAELKMLQAMVEYSKAPCRKNFIHAYFGFPGNEPCGSCDQCLKTP